MSKSDRDLSKGHDKDREREREIDRPRWKLNQRKDGLVGVIHNLIVEVRGQSRSSLFHRRESQTL